jgi:D-alanine transaminase
VSPARRRRAPQGRIAYVNGAYLPHAQAAVHVEDRGLQFADAVYEVYGVAGGALLDEEEHLDRLERSVREIGMAMPMPRAALKLVMGELVRRNRVDEGLVYLQVTRGALQRDHAIPKHAPRPTLIMTARRINPAAGEARRAAGVAVVTMPDQRWGRCDIKSTALLANILAKTAARDAGAFEAWLIDRDGRVTEGSTTTAWIVDAEGQVITRSLGPDILPGVTRRVILEVLESLQIRVIERAFTREEALSAREAFISAATLGALPVVSVDGKAVGSGTPGPVARRIQEAYFEEAERRAARKVH